MKFDLMGMLPEFYRSSPEMQELQHCIEKQVKRMWEVREDCFQQLFVDTATWGLVFWEEAYGIPTDREKSYAQRRARIIAKMRGSTPATLKAVQKVAESFTEQPVEVIELAREYRFQLAFSYQTIPPNWKDLAAAIREMRPAHLAFSFLLRKKAEQKAAVCLGTHTAAAQRIQVWPYLPPEIAVTQEMPVTTFASAGIKIQV